MKTVIGSIIIIVRHNLSFTTDPCSLFHYATQVCYL